MESTKKCQHEEKNEAKNKNHQFDRSSFSFRHLSTFHSFLLFFMCIHFFVLPSSWSIYQTFSPSSLVFHVHIHIFFFTFYLLLSIIIVIIISSTQAARKIKKGRREKKFAEYGEVESGP